MPEEATLLLFVAQQFHQKGLGYLLDAIRFAERSHQAGPLALGVVGRDDARPFRRQAARLGLTSTVRFLGSVERKDLWAYYAAADVLVLPTIFDSCSRTVLEALAMGTPAITTEHNGAGELVDKHGAGELIHSAWAIGELTGAIVRATDANRRREWSGASAGLADYVSVQRMADELLPIYRTVVQARRNQ